MTIFNVPPVVALYGVVFLSFPGENWLKHLKKFEGKAQADQALPVSKCAEGEYPPIIKEVDERHNDRPLRLTVRFGKIYSQL